MNARAVPMIQDSLPFFLESSHFIAPALYPEDSYRSEGRGMTLRNGYCHGQVLLGRYSDAIISRASTGENRKQGISLSTFVFPWVTEELP